MKKLLFATALVASAAAFADPINAISFEGYTPDAGVKVGNKGDTPDAQGGSNAARFYYQGEPDGDGSTVKAYDAEGNLAAPTIPRPTYFAQANNANYLDLSTEGGILWRSINTISSSTVGETTTYGLGDATNIVADGIYLDTLVQFTPTEDGGTPELGNEDKLAIWLNVDSSGASPVTNLMVCAGYIDDDGKKSFAVATNYTLVTQSPITAGTWYRLTVKAIKDSTKCMAKNPDNYNKGFTGFEIYLDGVQLAASMSSISGNYIDVATDGDPTIGWLDQSVDANFITYLQSGKLFPSLLGETTTATLTAVGFKGSGALDDIVWTEDNPLEAVGGEYPTYVGDDTTLQDQYDTWKALTGNAADTGSAYEKQFLLNTTQATAVADDALVIESITENATAGWDIVVSTSVTGAALSDGTDPTYNGYLSVIAADTLAGLSSATAVAYPVTAVAGGKVSINVTAGKFMKVQLSTTPGQAPAAAAGGQD